MKTTIVMIFLIGTPLCFAQKMVIEDLDANVLMEVNDEGSVGSISLPQGATPSDVSDKLYNEAGVLHWNGSALIPSQAGNSGKVLSTDGTNTVWKTHNVPMAAYTGGNQRMQITSNYGSWQAIRTLTMTLPASGTVIVTASGYVDWESRGWDLLLAGILCDEDPNSSWAAENHWYSYLNILTDYNCPDSSDQYTSFTNHRGFTVGAGTHTFYLWANKYASSSKTEVGDVNMSAIYIPSGTTAFTNALPPMEAEEPDTYWEDSVAYPRRRLR